MILMNILKSIYSFYAGALNVVPPNIRTIAAIVVLVILVVLFLKFVKKSVLWLIIFILLVPAAFPAIVQISQAIWNKVLKPLLS